MSVGTYGITRASDVNIEDIDVFYNYTPNRETENTTIFRLGAGEILSECYLPEDEQVLNYENLLEGLYNLKLPASIFNQLGIYTIYIKPRTIMATVMDCSVLSSQPTVRGIVLDVSELPTNLISNNSLQGYRIEYLDTSGNKVRNVVRYVVTSNRVVAVMDNVGNTTQKGTRYRFDDSGSLLFLQLTPSSASDVKPNAIPFIGNPSQKILVTNTLFTPIVLEIDMVENTIDTLSNMVAGEQIKDVQKGIVTYFDKEREITKQYNVYEIKDDVTDVSLFEVKELRTNIDETQNFDDVIT